MTGSCGDAVFAFKGGDAAVAVGAVAVGDVVGDGALGGLPVAVVGVVRLGSAESVSPALNCAAESG